MYSGTVLSHQLQKFASAVERRASDQSLAPVLFLQVKNGVSSMEYGCVR